MNRESSSSSLLMIYYLVTPLFAALDHFAGFDFRIAGLDSGVHRAIYYAVCTLLGLAGYFLPWLRAPVAVVESGLNIAILIIGTYAGLLATQDAIIAGQPHEPFTTMNMLGFLLAGSVMIFGFQARMRTLGG